MVVLRELMPGMPMRVEDDLKEQGENTLEKLHEAIERDDRELSLALSDLLFVEGRVGFDWTLANLEWIAGHYGEEEVPKALRHAGQIIQQGLLLPFTGVAGSDYVKLYSEFMRGLRSGPAQKGDFKIREEKDRWVMVFDPCGSGGAMIRRPQGGGSSLGKTTKPYSWAWSKVGVPYFCAHCCVWHEIMAIEKNGYPSRITECPGDDPVKACKWYVYKDPNLIPERYFKRVGFKKDPSRFKKVVDKK